MALAACRECRGRVSTEAASCPQCGAPSPIAPPLENPHQPRYVHDEFREWRSRRAPWLSGKGVVIAVGAVFVLLALVADPAPDPTSPEAQLAHADAAPMLPTNAEVAEYGLLLDRLQAKCPDEGRQAIANVILHARRELRAKGHPDTARELLQSLPRAIPDGVEGAVTCAELAAVILTLVTDRRR